MRDERWTGSIGGDHSSFVSHHSSLVTSFILRPACGESQDPKPEIGEFESGKRKAEGGRKVPPRRSFQNKGDKGNEGKQERMFLISFSPSLPSLSLCTN